MCFFLFFFYSYKLFDVERAELYLCVLRQLAVMYSSSPQHRSKMQQIYFPKLVKHSLEVLQEPSQQVQKFKPHTFAGFKKKKNSLFLGYSTLTFFSFSFSLPDSLCGKPGGSSSCYGVPGYGMWSCGAGSDRHGIRNHFWPEITE